MEKRKLVAFQGALVFIYVIISLFIQAEGITHFRTVLDCSSVSVFWLLGDRNMFVVQKQSMSTFVTVVE